MPEAHWSIEFCKDYSPNLFLLAQLFLVAALVLGVILAIMAALAARSAVQMQATESTKSPITAFLDSLKGFIEALKDAPTWLAMFAAGILLLWMAGMGTPDYCKPKTQTVKDAPKG